jgi:CRISPR system Cascade subunit CasC
VKIEVHTLQNFAPSCLNRDDTNAPKDCEFGGHRRARISSQCIKRAVRRHFAVAGLLPPDDLAERTKKLVAEVVAALKDRGREAEKAAEAVKAALAAIKVSADEQNETQYLLFLGRREIRALAALVDGHWDALTAAAAPATPDDKKPKGRKAKADAKDALPGDVAKKVKALFDGGKAADVALFGRMLADQPDLNVDAACQVAHALSTNRVSMEMDFFTAVDDLKSRAEDTGAGMLGTVDFNSACFYRYANIDFDQLVENLQGDVGLAGRAVEAFLRAAVEAVPTGKQNSMAAHNPPSLVLAVVRDRGLASLANAFVDPVRPDRDRGLVANSVAALDRYWGTLGRMYGDDGLRAVAVCAEDEALLANLKDRAVPSVRAVADVVLAQVPKGAS